MVADAYDAVSARAGRARARGGARGPLRLRRDQRRGGRPGRLRPDLRRRGRSASWTSCGPTSCARRCWPAPTGVPAAAGGGHGPGGAGRADPGRAAAVPGAGPAARAPRRARPAGRRRRAAADRSGDRRAASTADACRCTCARRAPVDRVSMRGQAGICRGMLRRAVLRPSEARQARRTNEGRPLARLPPACRSSTTSPSRRSAGPLDVIVKIGGAGVCRTDLHIIEGQWAAAMSTRAALHRSATRTPAGCTRSAPAVTNVAVGDTVILHPHADLRAVPRLPGRRRHALRATARSPACQPRRRHGRVPAAPRRGPASSSTRRPQPDGRRRAGRRRHHRLPRGAQGDPAALPGHDRAWCIGAGGLGHIGIQCLAALTATEHHRGRPQPGRAEAGRAARRAPHRGRRRRRTSTRSRT